VQSLSWTSSLKQKDNVANWFGAMGDRWGGFLGMTLAHRLAQQGKNVTLFEGAAQLGPCQRGT
jgi:hypothetical protein